MIPDNVTYKNKYNPAMHIEDPVIAAEYFDECIAHSMKIAHVSREEAEKIERENIGYWAGYFSDETRKRVETLFNCEHPFFGSIAESGPISATAAFNMGLKMAKEWQGTKS